MQDGNDKGFALYDVNGGVRDDLASDNDLNEIFGDLENAPVELLEEPKEFEKRDDEEDLSDLDLSAGTLDKQLKELIVLRVGFNSSAKYEVFQHRQVARVLDIAPEKVEALQGSPEAAVFSPLERDVLRLTDALLGNVKAPAELLAPVADALSPGQLIEVITVVGLYMLMCRLLDTLEIDIEDDELITTWFSAS